MNKLIDEINNMKQKYYIITEKFKIDNDEINKKNLYDYEKIFSFTDTVKWNIQDGINNIIIKINKNGHIKYSYNSKIDDNYSIDYNIYNNDYCIKKYRNILEVNQEKNLYIKNDNGILDIDTNNTVLKYKTRQNHLTSIDMQLNYSDKDIYKCIIDFHTHKKSNNKINGTYRLKFHQIDNKIVVSLQYRYRQHLLNYIFNDCINDSLTLDFINYYINKALIIINSDATKNNRMIVSYDTSIVNEIILLINNGYNLLNDRENIEVNTLAPKINASKEALEKFPIITNKEKVKKYY